MHIKFLLSLIIAMQKTTDITYFLKAKYFFLPDNCYDRNHIFDTTP